MIVRQVHNNLQRAIIPQYSLFAKSLSPSQTPHITSLALNNWTGLSNPRGAQPSNIGKVEPITNIKKKILKVSPLCS
jgi:hypothetical protein